MRLPPLNALRAFEAASRLLSFQQAADELNVTPSALSYQIKNLEEHLGITLFERGVRKVTLTKEGAKIRPGIASAFALLQESVDLLDNQTADNVIVVSCGPAHVKWLAPRLPAFAEAHPDLELRISANARLVDFAKDGVDVGIRMGGGVYRNLHVEHIFEEFLTPMVAPKLLSSGPPLKTPNDLKHYKLLHEDGLIPGRVQVGWKDWLKAAGATEVDASKGPHFNHADHCIEAAVQGVGVALARVKLSAEDLSEGRIIAPFDLQLRTGLITSFVCPPANMKKEKVSRFRDWLFSEIHQS